jgi:predicted extracellular nuclease
MSKLRVPLALLFALTACRDGSTRNPGDDDDDGDDVDDVAIQDIQSEDMPVGTAVTMRGVVVTAVDTYGGRTGSFYVMEPDGGPFSGVMVYANGSVSKDLLVGDVVDIEGAVKDEFALDTDESGETMTEMVAAEGGKIEVTLVGTQDLPPPSIVEPWEMLDPAGAEQWEGTLIQIRTRASSARRAGSRAATRRSRRCGSPGRTRSRRP